MGALEKFKNLFTINYEDFDDDMYSDELYDDIDEEPKKSKSKRKKYDEYDDDDFVTTKSSRSFRSNKKVVPMRSTRTAFEVTVIKPTGFNNSTEIIDQLLQGKAVVLNLEGLKYDVSQRIVDCVSGGCYAISGNLQRVSGHIYLITPGQIEISGDILDIVNGIDIDASANTTATY